MIEIAALSTQPEFKSAVELQEKIWGFSEIELLPVRLFVVATKIGGQVFGAFDGQRLVGFCLAIPGLKAGGKGYLHSHMLGVLPEYSNRGLGRAIKLAQREEALERGIDLIEWTFDPLELKNAYFNIEKLGAIIRRYVPNQYGTTSSFLHGGLPTDRCTAEWWIDSDRAHAAVNGRPAGRPAIEATIEVPTAIAELRKSDPKQARDIQQAVGERFQKLFGMGLAVIGFDRSEDAGSYLLGFWK
ncbi:MAG TPA: GNAT family N-acetyltransferase [Bryobacteraceae bacterium]|nr:GNAT family N-acetyltransferase [Bryobacteraceae bacterium]